MSQVERAAGNEQAERLNGKEKITDNNLTNNENIYATKALEAIRQAIRDVETLAGYRARHKRSYDRIGGVARELKELAKVVSLHRYQSL